MTRSAAFVTYNPATDTFLFGGIMDANIGTSTNGTSPSGLYVWGVNRGAGQPLFAANGVPGVVFDSVVVFRADGTGSVSSILPTSSTTALPSGTVQHVGSMIFGEVSGSFLPSTGFAKTDYTWNLWPRDGTLPAGFGQIADFAPDNSNSHVIVLQAVPEPASAGMLGIGLGALLLVAARRLRT